jgi:hypothetical protein
MNCFLKWVGFNKENLDYAALHQGFPELNGSVPALFLT